MQYGLSSQQLLVIEHIFRSILLHKWKGRIWIFGSRAAGRYRNYSDIDLLLDGDPCSILIISLISEALENTNLPFKIDLVDIHKLAPEYAVSVDASKKLLFVI